MSRTYLDFERSVAELDKQADALAESDPTAAKEIGGRAAKELKKLYAKLGPWEKAHVARHPGRPHFSDYVAQLVTDFTPLAGDRQFGDDHALLGGPGKLGGRSVIVMGHEKGKDLDTRLKHNFGMARPEGYRKAVRLMDLAERFRLPVVSFVDTAGAYPGRGAEERGQAEAIARSIDRGLSLSVPFVSVITGEGGSGGAVAIATADHVLMLEHSVYSVISPEGCASILWRDGARAEDAAKAMKITAQDLKRLGVIDGIVKEPVGGAHRAPEEAVKRVGKMILSRLEELSALDPQALRERRRGKFLDIGRTLPGAK
ncbi:acetyl-CoA carboxylase carboxyltransferase subunit alpha [uncultured Algimonas sp.]|uniref:acetyl-CoA carboxylase carboxyltransferase subunit alpha n=1 Tax=uncultured Algimonas sp. TaxID=1547920 RepID=UPI002620AF3C|nr:acetyl-CoA carboxylase carboxyltransferase subunit alpha [uncultured Algimonas sp.]